MDGLIGDDAPPLDGGESLAELAEVVRRVESEARRTLARELHDSVAQALTLMVVDMEHIKADVAGQSILVSGFDGLQQSAREALHRLREVLYELREEPAMDISFVADVRALLARLEARTGVAATLRVSGRWPHALSQVTVRHLRRILEEALDGTRPHRSVAAVEIVLRTTPRYLVVEVRDDGMPVEAGDARRRLGLMGMSERAVLLGGRLEFASGVDRGTTLRVIVPQPARATPAKAP